MRADLQLEPYRPNPRYCPKCGKFMWTKRSREKGKCADCRQPALARPTGWDVPDAG